MLKTVVLGCVDGGSVLNSRRGNDREIRSGGSKRVDFKKTTEVLTDVAPQAVAPQAVPGVMVAFKTTTEVVTDVAPLAVAGVMVASNTTAEVRQKCGGRWFPTVTQPL